MMRVKLTHFKRGDGTSQIWVWPEKKKIGLVTATEFKFECGTLMWQEAALNLKLKITSFILQEYWKYRDICWRDYITKGIKTSISHLKNYVPLSYSVQFTFKWDWIMMNIQMSNDHKCCLLHDVSNLEELTNTHTDFWSYNQSSTSSGSKNSIADPHLSISSW